MRISYLGEVAQTNAERLNALVEQAKVRFPYVIFLPFLSGNPNRGGYGLFSPEGIRAYNPDLRFQAPVFQAAFMGEGYDEVALIRALEAILSGGMPVGATSSGPAQATAGGVSTTTPSTTTAPPAAQSSPSWLPMAAAAALLGLIFMMGGRR